MLMACTGRNAVVICQSPAGKFASFDVQGGDEEVRGLSTRGKGLEGLEHVRDNGCSAWGPLSMSEPAFVSHELPSHSLPHPLIWFIYVVYLLPCNFLFSLVCFHS